MSWSATLWYWVACACVGWIVSQLWPGRNFLISLLACWAILLGLLAVMKMAGVD